MSAKIDLEGPARTIAEVASGNRIVRNVYWLKSFIRIILGIVWLIDGYLKFQPGLVDSFPDLIKSASQSAWLQPWFNFWYNVTIRNAAPFVYGIGILEVSLGMALVLGVLRKLACIGGVLLSLLIWSVPEGFGGPYGPGSTDVGTGIVYSFVFLSLIMINAMSGPSKYSLDYFIERRLPSWKRAAEFGEI